MHVLGQLTDASNTTWIARIEAPGSARSADAGPLVIYKPVAGEAPLWDFPHGSLAGRERAAYVISEAGEWHVVPPTILRDGPAGAGMVQEWIGNLEVAAESVVHLVEPTADLHGLIPVLRAEGEGGRPLLVAHEDAGDVRSLAVLDVVLNNTDRKGAHAFRHQGRLYAVDHGVTLHTEDKLRTVLWGWAGQPLPADEVARLERLVGLLGSAGSLREELAPLITRREIAALGRRIEHLLETGTHPGPRGRWPSIPWPPI